ncbi:alpha/beta hydrolase [Streptomyces sp. NBC_00233]|uniref:alpha/beta hydrolase n=1 Tax=Streptomyces sp. NBC_00233 TaxID=2975686 RepID=UPI0022505257|nr:alpha/beta hydrolase [Streptomyces sp. NBC_00233]MCX5231252.1 alpha/beta hydrolase [Streptomyces sp. NBC_00233]
MTQTTPGTTPGTTPDTTPDTTPRTTSQPTAHAATRTRSGRSVRRRRARQSLAAATAAVVTALAAAPAFAAPELRPVPVQQTMGRGTLLGVTPVGDLSRTEVAAFLKGAGIDASTVRHGVRGYRLTYRTLTPQGAPTTATGLLVLPKGGERRLDLVADTHGTMVHRDYAPSVAEDFGLYAPYLHAAAGRAVAAPDYLGLGKGPGLHPYMDTASSVSASLDMLRASRTAAAALGRPLTGDVYGTGFSQGGQVAMALGRELARGADRHFRLRALAPVAGPYDLRGAEVPALLDGRINDISGVFYMAYFLTAQNRLHPVYTDPAEAFRQPYAGYVEQLFDTRHTEEDIVTKLPGSVKDLLTDDFYERLGRPTGGLLAALKAQDGTCDWKPDVPVRLHTAAGDTDVAIANSVSCAADLARNGVKAPVLDHGKADHNGSVKLAGPQIVRWFDRLAHG